PAPSSPPAPPEQRAPPGPDACRRDPSSPPRRSRKGPAGGGRPARPRERAGTGPRPVSAPPGRRRPAAPPGRARPAAGPVAALPALDARSSPFLPRATSAAPGPFHLQGLRSVCLAAQGLESRGVLLGHEGVGVGRPEIHTLELARRGPQGLQG